MFSPQIRQKILAIINYILKDDTTYYAASLSFYTIFSIFPILALMIVFFSLNSTMANYVDIFMVYILDFINPIHSEKFVLFVKQFISNSDELGYIGIFYILFVFTVFFKDYEYIINKIHKTKSRGFHKSIIFYLAFMIFIPLVFVLFILTISNADNSIFSSSLAFIFSWFMFHIIFKISINRQISQRVVAISTFLTLCALIISKNIFIYLCFYNTTYETIYGSFSIVLFFFLWIYINWIIYLYGMRISQKLHILERALNIKKHINLVSPPN